MKRSKLHFDRLPYAAFMAVLTPLTNDEHTLRHLQTRLEAHLPPERERCQFMVRPYSKALRVAVLLEDANDPTQTSIATRLRLRYTEARAIGGRLSGEVTLEPGLMTA